MAKTIRLSVEEIAALSRLCTLYTAQLHDGQNLTQAELMLTDYLVNSAARVTNLTSIDINIIQNIRIKINEAVR